MSKFSKKSPSKESKDLDLPTLNDLVFLLLLFFIATMSITSEGGKKPPSETETKTIVLPTGPVNTANITSTQHTALVFRIETLDRDNPDSTKALYILCPNDSTVATEEAELEKIKQQLVAVPPDSSKFALFPADFLQLHGAVLDACRPFRLIADNIYKYQNELLSGAKFTNTVEIKADKDVEFKIVNYIMQQCSMYEDRIPTVTFRVLASRGEVE
jgi:biopolymer transport protein ExbD